MNDDRLAEQWMLLRHARHWLVAATLGVERLLEDTECQLGVAETIDRPLGAHVIATACPDTPERES